MAIYAQVHVKKKIDTIVTIVIVPCDDFTTMSFASTICAMLKPKLVLTTNWHIHGILVLSKFG